MRIRTWSAALIALALTATSCSENSSITTGPLAYESGFARATVAAPLPAVRISEFHYDNTGTDTGEQIEISGPAGASLEGWQLVLYNGSNRATYTFRDLTGTIPATCVDRGVVVIPIAGIQNGDPDAIALIRPGGNVVEFLSYGGTFVAANGPAIGMKSIDVGVKEGSTDPITSSIWRDNDGVWAKTTANTFGSCIAGVAPLVTGEVATIIVSSEAGSVNPGGSKLFVATAFDGENQQIVDAVFTWSTSASSATVNGNGFVTAAEAGEFEVTATALNGVAGTASLLAVTSPPLPSIRFSEIHYDNAGTDTGEAIEIEGPVGASLAGLQIVLYNGTGGVVYRTTALSGVIPNSCGTRGVVVVDYPVNGIQNDTEAIALVNGTTLVEFLSYEGVVKATDGPAAGSTSTDIGVSENSVAIGLSLHRNSSGVWQSPSAMSFGACNPAEVPPSGKSITISGRTAADIALPVGFEAQLFATLRDGSTAIETTITWTSDTPEIASVDANGVIRGISGGSAIFRATAADMTTATRTLPIAVPTASRTAQYEGNAAFGEPIDGDASDDFIILRTEFTTSFNKNRNTPNWVSYDLDASQFGTVDRCNCFTHDPLLPPEFARLTTADYTGAGAAAGYLIDRGHLARSFDRSSGTLDNARTFYFSNIIPQAAALNQGTWATMENELGNLARSHNKEVYIIAGVAGIKGTIKDEDKITIPSHVWKVALILPRDHGLADVRNDRDVEAVAVIMRNDADVTAPWRIYSTTVDAVEALSGYDLLALLPDETERTIESSTMPLIATVNGPYASAEGSSVSMSGTGSLDPNATIVSYEWDFGDGATGTGAAVSHTYAQDREYTVRMTATDNNGVRDITFAVARVTNVAPAIAPFAGAILLPGETYSSTGSFTDPGVDPWTATVNYGDGGGGTQSLSLSGKSFSLAHTYNVAGAFTVTVGISDDDVTSTRTQTVNVLSHARGIDQAVGIVADLSAAGALSSGNANSLTAKLSAASKQVEKGHHNPAVNQLEALLNELRAMGKSGRLTESEMEPLRTLVSRLIQSLSL